MTNEATKLSDVKYATPVFGARLAEEDFVCGNVTIKLRALPSVVYTYIWANRNDRGLLVMNQVRFGVADVVGLVNDTGHAVRPEFEMVSVCGAIHTALSMEWLNKVAKLPLGKISDRVLALTELTHGEEQSLDFTGDPSAADTAAGEEPDATAAAP